MEQQPPSAAAAVQNPTHQPQQQEQEQALAWASPPRPPFAHGDGHEANIDDGDAAAATTSTSTATCDSSLAAAYSRKLLDLRALVTDAHFRGKDLAGKGERERERRGGRSSKGTRFLVFSFSFLFVSSLNP